MALTLKIKAITLMLMIIKKDNLRGGLGQNYMSVIKTANLRIEANFTEALDESITAFVYGIFKDAFQVDSFRNILPRKI